MQNSPTPSSSTSRSLTSIGSESVSNQYQNNLGFLLKIEVRDKKQRKRRENMSTFSPLRSWRERKTFHENKGVLSVFTQEFSLVMWLSHVRPGNEPKKYWSVPIFWGLSDRAKKKSLGLLNVVYNAWVRRKGWFSLAHKHNISISIT